MTPAPGKTPGERAKTIGNTRGMVIDGAGRLAVVLALCLCILPLHAKPVTAMGPPSIFRSRHPLGRDGSRRSQLSATPAGDGSA